MNTSRYVCLPDLESTDEEEEEKDPIAKLSKKQKKEELGRKDRWIAKFEKESQHFGTKVGRDHGSWFVL